MMADRTSPAQADGSYLFDLLPPGTYELITTAQGFQSLRQTGIVITAGFTATVNSHLQIGQVQQTVTLAGEREFVFRERLQIEPMVDLFNLTNGQTVVSRVQTFGPNYQFPTNTINPFLARFGLKVNF
jgi:hypothetical protein